MNDKLLCFIISPIGDNASETRKNADLLLKMIHMALDKYNVFEIQRGDHRSDSGRIDQDVIKAIHEAELCICDISEPNPNVYYELGMRDETGKEIILLKSKTGPKLPVDIGTRKYIEYDLESATGMFQAVEEIQRDVDGLFDKGFENNRKTPTVADLAESLQRLEKRIESVSLQISKQAEGAAVSAGADGADGESVEDRFRLALLQNNIPAAEQTMEELRYRYENLRWLDIVVEQVAAIGSLKAGQLLINNAQTFIDSDVTFKKKVEYLGALVTYANKTDNEGTIKDLTESLYAQLEAVSDGEDPRNVTQIYNQLNRLYYGIYVNTGEEIWAQKAIEQLHKAYQITRTGYVCYNLALCYHRIGEYENARRFIEECLEFDRQEEKKDTNHLELACTVFFKLGDARYEETMKQLADLSPTKATILRGRLNGQAQS